MPNGANKIAAGAEATQSTSEQPAQVCARCDSQEADRKRLTILHDRGEMDGSRASDRVRLTVPIAGPSSHRRPNSAPGVPVPRGSKTGGLVCYRGATQSSLKIAPTFVRPAFATSHRSAQEQKGKWPFRSPCTAASKARQ